MIKKEGNKWVLYNETGDKIIGKHDTREAAEKQERAILVNKV